MPNTDNAIRVIAEDMLPLTCSIKRRRFQIIMARKFPIIPMNEIEVPIGTLQIQCKLPLLT